MLSIRCQNSQKNENTQTSEVNSNFFQKFVGNMIHHYNCQAFMILVLFTVPFYHFLFLRYLVLAERHFLSDILVPFPDLCNLYSLVGLYNGKPLYFNQHSIPSKRSSFILLFIRLIQLIEHCCLKVQKKSLKSICLVMVGVTPQAAMQNTGLTH